MTTVVISFQHSFPATDFIHSYELTMGSNFSILLQHLYRTKLTINIKLCFYFKKLFGTYTQGEYAYVVNV